MGSVTDDIPYFHYGGNNVRCTAKIGNQCLNFLTWCPRWELRHHLPRLFAALELLGSESSDCTMMNTMVNHLHHPRRPGTKALLNIGPHRGHGVDNDESGLK